MALFHKPASTVSRRPARRLLHTRGQQSAPWGWAASGALLGLLLSLLMFAPARWLSGWVQQASSGQFQFQEARGTLWSGSARLTLTGGTGSLDAATLPGRFQWQLRPALTGGALGLVLQLSADCCLAQPWAWHLAPRWGGWQLALSNSTSQWPAQWLSGLGTPWNTIDPQGQLALSTQALTVSWASGRWQLAGRAQLDALDLSSRLSTLQPMGSYRFMLGNGAGSPELQLSTLSGALQLSGRGQWVGGKLRFEGEASSGPESQAALSNLLNIIGRRNGARSIIKVG